MNQGERLLRGSGIGQQVTLRVKPYEWGGNRGWDPAKLGRMPTLEEERAERHAKFAQARETGLSVQAAGELLGLTETTARWYERQRVRKAGAA